MSDTSRLLVVDDHPEVTDLIREIALDDRYDVRTLNNSQKFFQTFDEFQPAVLCIDVHMPDVDGIEILNWLVEKRSDVGVIILTGGDPLFAKVAQRIGSAANLSIVTVAKPFSLGDIRTALRDISGRTHSVVV